MRFTHPCDHIFDSAVKVRILRFFCRKGGAWSGRRVAAELGLNPATTHTALRRLHEATVLELRKVGNSFVYSLRGDHYLVRVLLRPLFLREAQADERLRLLLTHALDPRFRSQVVSVALYGSVARHQERPTSDIDLLVLVTSQEAKSVVQRAFDRLGTLVMREFHNPLSPYLNTVREARQKLSRGMPVFRNILAHHEVLWGRPLREVLRDGAT